MRHAPAHPAAGTTIGPTTARAIDLRSSAVTELDPNATATDLPPPGPIAADPVPATSFDDRFDELAELSYRLAYRMLGSREDARDIAQETMARAYARWPKVRDAARGWVARVSTNLALDLIRKRRRRPTADDQPGVDHATGVADRAELVAALVSLPRRQRDVVALRYLADLPEAEVARALGCSVGTVKQHAHRGLAALRVSLTPPPVPPAGTPGAFPAPPAPETAQEDQP